MPFWEDRSDDRRRNDLWRDPPLVTARGGGWIEHGGRRWTDFSSNDALGLGREGVSIMAESGAGASRLVTGELDVLRECEVAVAGWCGFESGLLFPSGWQANVTALSALFGPGDVVISDELNHASIVDGLRLSGCDKVIVPHCDAGAVARALEEHGDAVRGIVVESLYSVNGDFHDLDALRDMAAGRDLVLYVDEAHACGLYGGDHSGRLVHDGAVNVVKVVTCSKALGCQGGVVLSSESVRAWMVNAGRGFIYSTGCSPVLASLIRHNVNRATTEDLGRVELFGCAGRLRETLLADGLNVISDPGSHVVAVDFDGHEAGRRALDRLHEESVWPAFLRWPTVPRGRSRLRFSLCNAHSTEDVDRVGAILR